MVLIGETRGQLGLFSFINPKWDHKPQLMTTAAVQIILLWIKPLCNYYMYKSGSF